MNLWPKRCISLWSLFKQGHPYSDERTDVTRVVFLWLEFSGNLNTSHRQVNAGKKKTYHDVRYHIQNEVIAATT